MTHFTKCRLGIVSGVLAFGSNNLIGEVPTELGRLQQLGETFVISYLLSGLVSTIVSNRLSLGFLGLQKNSLIGTIPTELSQLTGLSK
jgi:hypothetical protein